MVKDRRSFKTQKDAIAFLVGEGFDSNKSNFSRHTREGKVGKSAEGVFEAEALLAYARLHVKTVDSGKTLSREDKERSKAKADAELELVQEKARRERIKREKEEGRVVSKSDLHVELGSRAGVLDSMLRSALQKRIREFVDIVNGKPSLAGELLSELNATLDQAMNEYARTDTFKVVFADED